MNFIRTKSSLAILVRLLLVLRKKRKIQALCLLIVMLISSISEVFSLAAVFPFIGLILQSEKVMQNHYVRDISSFFGITSSDQLVLPVTLIFIIAVIFSAFIRLLNLWLNKILAAAISSDLSISAFESVIYQPYTFHIDENSSSIISLATGQIDRTTTALNLLLMFISSLLICISLIITLLFINLKITISLVSIFSLIYLFQAISVRKRLLNIGKKLSNANKKNLQNIQETLGSIKDILLDNNQKIYIKSYGNVDIKRRRLQAQIQFITSFPKYLTEAIGIILIAILIYYLFSYDVDGDVVITTVGTIALGLQRLLPQIFSLYSSWAGIKGQCDSIEEVLEMVKNKGEKYKSNLSNTYKIEDPKLISMRSISFRYKLNSPKILDNINLKIEGGERIGIIGVTGSGKSTLIDILIGLLEPSSGSFLVDNYDLYDKKNTSLLKKWRFNISHVPQDVFLCDSSIIENIAFGIEDSSNIDMDLVKNSARKARIAEFIESLPNGYNTYVGERGINLSGGQKQRIGIARALYKKKKILILDESTSALDTNTEKEVIESILGLGRDITLIMISHRLNTLSICDRIIRIDNGLLSNVDN